MNVITAIINKGGAGKSTIAFNTAAKLALDGHRVLLIDIDPQAQLTEWLQIGDGLSAEGSIAAVLQGHQALQQVVHPTLINNLSFVPSSDPLEEFGHRLITRRRHELLLSSHLQTLEPGSFDYVVIDSPNQISPIMRNAIHPADLFIIPIEDTKTVKTYAKMYSLLTELRPAQDYEALHVLNRHPSPPARASTIRAMERDGIPIAPVEIRQCLWLAQSDERGGRSIFQFRPSSNGAHDIAALATLIVKTLSTPAKAPAL